MLVVSRKKNESMVIDNDITITVVEIRGDKVRLGIVAPRDKPVHRQEVYDALHACEPREQRSPTPPAQEEEITEMIIVEARLQRGRKIRFTSEGGIRPE